jgi:hypothetical protein
MKAMQACMFGVLCGGMLMVSGSAIADHWKFDLINESDHAAIEFRTQEDGEWSRNWLRDRIELGATFEMDFGTSEGDCTIRT